MMRTSPHMPNRAKSFSSRLTGFYAKLGFANRTHLAKNLNTLETLDHEAILDRLTAAGILKQRFRGGLTSLEGIDSHMLSGRISQAKMEALGNDFNGVFPNSGKVLEQLSDGIFQVQSSALQRLITCEQGGVGTTLAFALGAGSAAVIGATLLGIPAAYLLGAGTVYGLVSATLVNRVDPHSKLGKAFELGSRLLPFALTGCLLYGSFVTYGSGFMFIEAMKETFGSWPLIGLGAAAAGTVAWTARDIGRAYRSNLGYLNPLSKRHIASNIAFSNLKIFSGIHYLAYRVLLFSAFAVGSMSFHFSGLSWVALAAGLAVRIAIPRISRERATEWIANKLERGVNRVNSKTVVGATGNELFISGRKDPDKEILIRINDGNKSLPFKGNLAKILADARSAFSSDYSPQVEKAIRRVFRRAQHLQFDPITQVVVEYLSGMTIKYGALLVLLLPFAESPWALLFDLATIYAGYWTIYADILSGTASIGSALNSKRSMFNPEDPYISDADRSRTSDFCARLTAYIKDVERNFSKIVNMLTMEYPHLEAEFCSELYPYGNLGAIQQLRSAREAHALIREWRDDIYAHFQAGYEKFLTADAGDRGEVRRAALELAQLLNQLGDRYTRLDDPSAFIPRLRELIAADANRPEAERWFNLKKEEPFVRQAYEAVRYRGFRFYEMAKDLEGVARLDFVQHRDLESLYKEMLGIFSVEFNHVQRKIDHMDDLLGQKTANLSWPETHLGDTLYQVWRLVPEEEDRYAFRPSYVPSTYVRINDPAYNHRKGDAGENQRYLWIRREDLLEVLGISQAMSNDLHLVDNTPANISEIEKSLALKIAGHALRVRGFYSNEKTLPPNHLIDWQGQTVPQSDFIWTAGAEAPPGFREKFKAWARNDYGGKYDAWIEKFGPEALWFIDRPEILVLAPADNYNVFDEAYIAINTERELQAELNYSKNMIIRVVNHDRWRASFPNPDAERPVEHVKAWSRQDAFVGFRYKTTDGKEYNIPYPENRAMFVKGMSADMCADISYGLIKEYSQGGYYIEVHAKDGRYLGIVDTEWPHHMHPPDKIEGKRIEIDAFAEEGKGSARNRVGMATWLVADYGENYGAEPYERFRFSFLDFDREAKQQFHPNFIVSLEVSKDKKRLAFTTLSTNCETFPFDKKWAGISTAEEVEVLEVDTSNHIFLDPETTSWSPRPDARHTVELSGQSLLLLRDSEGKEMVLPVDLPRRLSALKQVRKVIDIEHKDGKLVFTRLRRGSRIKDTPQFIYSLPEHLVEANPEYKKLKWLLNEQDLTVRVSENGEIELFDEKGGRVDIALSAGHLVDNAGAGFLQSAHLGPFYQRADNRYQGTEEYRPRLVKVDGKIKMILTRVDRTSILFKMPEGIDPIKILVARPTSSARIRIKATGEEKWVPLSLTKPITYQETPNVAAVGVKIGDKTRYFNTLISKDLPELSYLIKYDKEEDRFFAYTPATERQENGFIKTAEKRTDAVSPEVEEQIRKSLAENGITEFDEVTMEIFHTRSPEVINGEYHSVVHGQRQHGTFYKKEAHPASEQAQFRDEFFYGVVRSPFSEAFPPGREPRSGGLQTGKTWDFDENDKYSGKPIENGTPFLGKHRHLFELAEVLMGIPKGGNIYYGMRMGRAGGFEKAIHKPNFAKLTLYNREKGWLSGVSEDEQGVLSLSLSLGYSLKYHLKCTAFEAQPNTYGQVEGQDTRRYNAALALGQDVLVPYEMRELLKRLAGKRIAGTWKQKFEHFLFRSWYEWPKAELAREFSPAVFLLSNGRIKPYIVDPYFIFAYLLDLGAGLAMYANMRHMLGRNKETTDHGTFYWSFLQGPAMNQAFFFPATRGILELFRKGWQYGAFVITALQKSDIVQEENKKFLKYMIGILGGSLGYGLASTVPGALALGISPFDWGYFFNEFWAAYAILINAWALRYMRKNEATKEFDDLREEISPKIDRASDEIGNRFFAAYQAYRQGDRDLAVRIWREIVERDEDYKIMNWVLLSEEKLKESGVDLSDVKPGKMLKK